jgi:uncharacterized ParB-like nuclease family protein
MAEQYNIDQTKSIDICKMNIEESRRQLIEVNDLLKITGLSDTDRKDLKKRQARLCLTISEQEVAVGNYADEFEFFKNILRSALNPGS